MAHRLDGPRAKVERAKKHLHDLEGALQRFFESNPYEIIIEDNPKSGRREHRVIRADPPAPCIPLITGDVVHNLRSALDHLIWQLVIANGGNPHDHKSAFPIWRSEAAYKSGRPGDAKGISKAALDILYELKPYQGGNAALWRLHQLDIVDKHRLLLTVAAAHRSVIIDASAIARATFADQPGYEWVARTPNMPVALAPTNPAILAPGVVLFNSPLETSTTMTSYSRLR